MKRKKAAGETIGQHIKAQFSGAVRTGGMTLEHELSGDCENPVYTEIYGSKSESRVTCKVTQSNLTIRWVRCRKCAACRRAKARHWAARISSEHRLWPRSWFVTFTMTPEEHIRFEYSNVPQNKALTDMFKRMRKAGKKFRYVLVQEQHKSGQPHWHAILHERVDGCFTSRELSGNQREGRASLWWPHGFVHCRLLPKDAQSHKVAWYVCKYVAKDADSRIRASQRYGMIV